MPCDLGSQTISITQKLLSDYSLAEAQLYAHSEAQLHAHSEAHVRLSRAARLSHNFFQTQPFVRFDLTDSQILRSSPFSNSKTLRRNPFQTPRLSNSPRRRASPKRSRKHDSQTLSEDAQVPNALGSMTLKLSQKTCKSPTLSEA